jgi:hypothetical protein
MKKLPHIPCLLAVILLSVYAAAVDSDSYTSTTEADYTSRLEATINITYAGPPANYTLRAGEWFNMSASIFCNVSYCGIVTIYPLYCKGAGCDKFTSLGTESSADIYTKNETPRRCLGVDVGKKCSFLWRICSWHLQSRRSRYIPDL